jgi:antirestriction protein
MRVWIGCLACYNEGTLLGQWYEADEAGEVTTRELHAAAGVPTTDDGYLIGRDAWFGPHEELWCLDVDEAPEGLHREMSPSEAQEIGDLLNELERQRIDADAFAAYCSHVGADFKEDTISDFEEAYNGEWDSREDFAQELADDLGLVPDEQPWPLSYIDWERAARDLFMDYFDAPAPGGRIYVFRSI